MLMPQQPNPSILTTTTLRDQKPCVFHYTVQGMLHLMMISFLNKVHAFCLCHWDFTLCIMIVQQPISSYTSSSTIASNGIEESKPIPVSDNILFSQLLWLMHTCCRKGCKNWNRNIKTRWCLMLNCTMRRQHCSIKLMH